MKLLVTLKVSNCVIMLCYTNVRNNKPIDHSTWLAITYLHITRCILIERLHWFLLSQVTLMDMNNCCCINWFIYVKSGSIYAQGWNLTGYAPLSLVKVSWSHEGAVHSHHVGHLLMIWFKLPFFIFSPIRFLSHK
jgi:hypothetical protein